MYLLYLLSPCCCPCTTFSRNIFATSVAWDRAAARAGSDGERDALLRNAERACFWAAVRRGVSP